MKWREQLSGIVAGLFLVVCAAGQEDWWQLPITKAHYSQEYNRMFKYLRRAEPNEAELEELVTDLKDRFLQDNSLVALDLMLISPAIRSRIQNDQKLRLKLVYHLLLTDWPGDVFAVARNRERYITRMFPKELVFLFVDGLCKPIAGARVEVFRRLKGEGLIGIKRTDENGLLFIDIRKCRYDEASFVVHHPRYGTAFMKYDAETWPRVDVPLVNLDLPESKGAIWGEVIDDGNQPVADARIVVSEVTAVGGGELRSQSLDVQRRSVEVLTDEQGRFGLYLPRRQLVSGVRGVPAGARYQIWIVPPANANLATEGRTVTSGRRTIIRLKHPPLYPRRFIFEDANGPIEEVGFLKCLALRIKLDEYRYFRFGYDRFKDGGLFPPGRYQVEVGAAWPGAFRGFEPVEVNAESPEEIVFRPWPKEEATAQTFTVFSGRAVYGLGDVGIEGAFVICTKRPYNYSKDFSVAMITEKQWAEIYQLGSQPDPNDPALEPLQRCWPFDKIVRTDSDGSFELAVPSQERARSICLVHRGFLPVLHQLSCLEYKGGEKVELPVSRLFPAGKVSFRLSLAGRSRAGVYMSWDVHGQELTERLKDFILYRNQRGVLFALTRQLECGQPYTIYIPAGIGLRLLFQLDDFPIQRGTPTMTRILKVGAGQSLDLGTIDLGERISVYVQVVDADGGALNGITVHHGLNYGDHKHYFLQNRITDEQGLACFNVPPYYQASFIVACRDDSGRPYSESIDYQTNGFEDANNVYVMQLSDEMVGRLFGK